MSKRDNILQTVDLLLGGIRGRLNLCLVTYRDVDKKTLRDWIKRLRHAADMLEKML